jgi:hypothetical protein
MKRRTAMQLRIGAPAFALALVVILTSIGLLSPFPANASDPDFVVIKSRNGAVVVWNEATAYFTLELPGSRFVPAKLPGASFIIDGRVVQVFTVRVDHFSESPSCEGNALRCYKEWELAYRRSRLGASIAARDLASPAPGFEAWEVEVPAETAGSSATSVTKQVYATRAVEKLVLVLSYSVTKAEPVGSAETYLGHVATSLHVYGEPVDVEGVRQEIGSQRPTRDAHP